MIIATTNSIINHYGSTQEGPISSSLNHTPTFVKVNGEEVILSNDTINTPSHIYDYDNENNPLYHEHPNQAIDYLQNDYVKVNGQYIVVIGDKNTVNDTRIDSTSQNFVKIN